MRTRPGMPDLQKNYLGQYWATSRRSALNSYSKGGTIRGSVVVQTNDSCGELHNDPAYCEMHELGEASGAERQQVLQRCGTAVYRFAIFTSRGKSRCFSRKSNRQFNWKISSKPARTPLNGRYGLLCSRICCYASMLDFADVKDRSEDPSPP